jgi:hypothetical protein
VIATIVDVGKMLQLVWVSLVAGVGVTAAFSITVLAATRSGERRRSGRDGPAIALGVLAAVAGACCLATMAYGVYLITKK